MSGIQNGLRYRLNKREGLNSAVPDTSKLSIGSERMGLFFRAPGGEMTKYLRSSRRGSLKRTIFPKMCQTSTIYRRTLASIIKSLVNKEIEVNINIQTCSVCARMPYGRVAIDVFTHHGIGVSGTDTATGAALFGSKYTASIWVLYPSVN